MIRSILIIVLVLIPSCWLSCYPQQPSDSDFGFRFEYGVTRANKLDTFHNTYTKDMIRDPSIRVALALTDEEKQKIYDKMIEIDFFDYPEQFKVVVPPGQPVRMGTPASCYYFHVECDSKKKDLSWCDNITNYDTGADKLRELIRLIQGIVEGKDEYKRLPHPSGGYL